MCSTCSTQSIYVVPCPPNELVAPLAALLALGVAVATGAYALIDDDQVSNSPSSKVIVLDSPATPGAGVSAKNEAGTAAAISTIPAPSAGASAKDEAATAASIGTFASPGAGVSTKDEAASAAAISTAQPNERDPLSAHQPRKFPIP